MKGKGCSGIFGIAAQRQHEGVAVDDAGGGREQGCVAIQRRLQCARGIAREGLQIKHAIGLGVSPDRLQFRGLIRRRRDDQLTAVAMRDAVIAAVLIQRALAADAHPRHQAPRRIIDAGVDHLAVARRGCGPDTFRRLQDDYLAACLRQPPRDGEADHPRTDNDALNFIHSQLGPGYSTRRACDEAAALRINRIRTLSLCRKSLFRGVFRPALPLVKH